MLLPGIHVPDVDINYWDKFIHVLCYAIFTFFLLKGFFKMSGIKNYFLITAVISIGYGTVLELFQSLIPGRAMDIYDLIANIFGCIVVLAIFPFVHKIE